MRVLSGVENWPRSGQWWKREGEPMRVVVTVIPPLAWNPGVYFEVWPTRAVHFEDWDEWMWWASDAELQIPKRVRLW